MRFSNILGDLLCAPTWIRDEGLLRIPECFGLRKDSGKTCRGDKQGWNSKAESEPPSAYIALVSVAGAAVAPLGTAGVGW